MTRAVTGSAGARANAAADHALLRLCGMVRPEDAGHGPNLADLGVAQWRRIELRARHHGFAGLVARNLEWVARSTGFRAPVLDSLSALRRAVLAQNLARKAAARRVAEALGHAGIPFVALKGVALAEETYGDLSLRGFNDFDVLVAFGDIDAAHDVARSLGYSLTRLQSVHDFVRYGAHAAGMAHRDGTSVDLHWAIAPELSAPRHRTRVWEGRTPRDDTAAFPGLRLAPELELIHHAVHFHSHQYAILKPLVDFHFSAAMHEGRIDPDRLVSTARVLDMLPVVGIAARLAQRSFGEGPPFLRRLAEGTAIVDRLVPDGLLVDAENRSRIGNWTRYLMASGSARAAARGVAEMLFPSRLVLAQFFNRPFSAGLYPRYYWRQVVKVVTLSNK